MNAQMSQATLLARPRHLLFSRRPPIALCVLPRRRRVMTGIPSGLAIQAPWSRPCQQGPGSLGRSAPPRKVDRSQNVTQRLHTDAVERNNSHETHAT